jgi:hypothetical protein
MFSHGGLQSHGVPLDPKTKSKKNVNKDDKMVKVPYQQAMGSLMYAMLCTRPDLAYPISVVSQHMANSSLEHWIAVKRIFRYLQGTLHFKLCFRGLDIVMWIGLVTLRIGGPPKGLYS